ncbi:MAG: excinuclease ABC subunit UvrA [Lentisphaerae bacterium]|nr:excinuclease ABC subunit UvrA [Lentisphaerota bacterium]
MNQDWITIAGAREHNLKNITVRLPRNRLTVITGLSGSGKSSLAFDTLYAEGQRRYVESLSAYARQFLEQMQKPDVDYIEGLSPAIAIEQRTAGSNPRSIVATSTEIHDYLRLLFATIGRQHCPRCRRPVARQSAEQIVERLLKLPARTKLTLLAPLVRGRKGQHTEVFESARRQGFVRVRVDGALRELDAVTELDKKKKHSIDLVVDRLIITNLIRTRLTDSTELALRQGASVMIVLHQESDGQWRETLYSEKHACANCGISFEPPTPRHFSFNSPYGACPTCSGIGARLVFDEALVAPNRELGIEKGAIHAWRRGGRRLIIYYNGLLRALATHYGFSLSTPFRDLGAAIQKILFYGSGDEAITFGYWRRGAWRKLVKPFEGILPNLARRYAETDSEFTKKRLEQYMSRRPCADCQGARLKPEVLACTIAGKSIAEVCRMAVRAARDFFERLELSPEEQQKAHEVLKEIRQRLQFLANVGLDYLTLDRESGTLSGGEAQRIRLATQIGSGLVGVLYVLDEPSIGLHHRDNQRLISTLKNLRDLGNTVVVVEHDEDTIRQADFVLDLGPGAGRHGGAVVFAGAASDLLADPNSLTARYLNGLLTIAIPRERKTPKGELGRLTISGACENNLKNITISIPLGLFVCVTGVSGSGKSTLIDDILRRALFRKFYGAKELPGKFNEIKGMDRLDKVVVIDQSPIGRTPRSNPATYTGAFTLIRALFAGLPASKVRGYGPGRYSFNVKGGRCEACCGDGILRIEMHFLPDVYVTCEQCGGRRYNRETLEVRYAGKSIADTLAMTIDEALEFFGRVPALRQKLKTLSEVGLGYVQLGQSATTLSGGEAQRVKLSAELSRKATGRTLYLLDEPTTGLHFADIQKLLDVLHRLRDAGNTVVVIEHNVEVIKTADYIIDLGPEGGDEGGEVVVYGTPEEVAACDRSYTGELLRRVLAAAKAREKLHGETVALQARTHSAVVSLEESSDIRRGAPA